MGDEDAVDGTAGDRNPMLPMTLRPRNIRIVAYGLAALVLATMVILAVVLPETWRPQDRFGLVVLGLVGAAALYLLARPRLVAGPDEVTVVNGIRTHVLEWAEIIDIRMPIGEPWPTIDLANGATLAVLGIQSSDGALAQTNLARFRGLLRDRGEAQEPGSAPG